MLKLAVMFALCPCLAQAWIFSPEPICTLSFSSPGADAEITYDGEIYTLTLSHPDGWPQAEVFAIQFGPKGPLISTTRHKIDGPALVVSDSGFGNVLTGLEANTAAIAILGPVQRVIDLRDAAPAVATFKACDPAPALS